MKPRCSRSLCRRLCGTFAELLLACGLSLAPSSAFAYGVNVAWEPVAGVAGYKLYIRFSGDAYGAPINVGQGTPVSGGLLRATVQVQASSAGTHYVLTAYDDTGRESLRSNELSLAYADIASVIDSDGDGLTDAEEDLNLNGIVDPGETDPNLADTDGDGINDGDERADKTDPTDPNDGPCNGPDGPDPSCDDGNVCTSDLCLAGACQRVPNGGVCDDGLTCTTNDTCADGVCNGSDVCPIDRFCDLGTDACEPVADYNKVWVPAATYQAMTLRGAMRVSSEYTHGFDADPAADALAPLLVYADSTEASLAGGSGDEVAYTVVLPKAGDWYLWGRLYYPGAPGSNDANSFLVRVDGGAPAKFGNNRDFFQRWHWGGDGEAESGTPTGLALGFLAAGEHELVVEKREVQPIAPRLDALFLTMDAGEVPTDAEASQVVDFCPGGTCGSQVGTLCGDASGDGRVTATDSWVALTSAIGFGTYCSLSTCDADGNGRVNATDAVAILYKAVNLPSLSNCPPTIAFAVPNADGLEDLTISLDYSAAAVAFADAQRPLTCRATYLQERVSLDASDDPVNRTLTLAFHMLEPLTGSHTLGECRIIPTDGVVPSADSFQATVVSYGTSKQAGKAPAIDTNLLY